MKKLLKLSSAIMVVVAALSIGLFVSCKEEDENTNQPIATAEIDLKVDAYALKACLNDREVYVVNTQEDYKALLSSCVDYLPWIDFYNHSFIIVRGQTGCLNSQTMYFSKISTNSYDLEVNLHLAICSSMDPWYSAFITNTKIADDASINLEVKTYY